MDSSHQSVGSFTSINKLYHPTVFNAASTEYPKGDEKTSRHTPPFFCPARHPDSPKTVSDLLKHKHRLSLDVEKVMIN